MKKIALLLLPALHYTQENKIFIQKPICTDQFNLLIKLKWVHQHSYKWTHKRTRSEFKSGRLHQEGHLLQQHCEP